jgi:hypothetical protein
MSTTQLAVVLRVLAQDNTRNPSKRQKRPSIGAKETYYVNLRSESLPRPEDLPPHLQLSGIIVADTANTSKVGLAYHRGGGEREKFIDNQEVTEGR